MSNITIPSDIVESLERIINKKRKQLIREAVEKMQPEITRKLNEEVSEIAIDLASNPTLGVENLCITLRCEGKNDN